MKKVIFKDVLNICRGRFAKRAAAVALAAMVLMPPGAAAGAPPEKASNGSAKRSVVTLNDGNFITGDILRTKPDSVIVDNDGGVLQVPRQRIKKIAPFAEGAMRFDDAKGAAARDEAGTGTGAVSLLKFPPFKLFPVRDSSPEPIEALVERFEDGVVQVKTPSGTGSGFIISDEGHVITNFHVIENETQIGITIFEKTKNDFNRIKLDRIKIIALNPFYDLALLKIEDKVERPLVKCSFAKSPSWRKGEAVFAIGNPYGLTRSISQGIISDRDRYINGLIYIQTTAPINAGNSGGPLFDMNGDVIGVINMAYLRSDGIGFGIPLNYIYDFLANAEAYSYDRDNPNTGYMYNAPPERMKFGKIPE